MYSSSEHLDLQYTYAKALGNIWKDLILNNVIMYLFLKDVILNNVIMYAKKIGFALIRIIGIQS